MAQAYVFTEYGGSETQEFVEQDRPTPGAGEILVKVHAAGVNPVDWKIRQGYLAEVMPVDLPAVLGSEAAGTVLAVGQDVDGFTEHDEVFGAVATGSGGYAEYTLLTAATTATKPVQVSWADAASLSVAGSTAFDAVNQLALTEGQTLLINGIGGGIGVIAAQLARDAGVFVVGTASESKRELVESLGATLVTYGEGVADRVRELLPDGVDGVLDLVGGDALRAVAPLAKNPATVLTTSDPQTVAEVGGVGVQRDGGSRSLAEIAALVAEGKLDPHVTDTVPFERAGEALAAVESGHVRGNVVVTFG